MQDAGPAAGSRSRQLTRDVFLGFMGVHILHHAAQAPIFGLERIEELRRHGHSIGPATLYPMLHALEEAGALRSTQKLVDGKTRRYYRTTKLGDALLATMRMSLRELVDEILERPARSSGRRPGVRRR
jgi:DNA-binding PadR family transcriptional regulator